MSSVRIRVGDLDVTGLRESTDGGRTVFLLSCNADPSTLFLLLHERVRHQVTEPAARADWGSLERVHLPSWTDDGRQAVIRCEARLPSSSDYRSG